MSDMVATIRRATALMRSRSAAASPSPWLADTDEQGDVVVWGAPKMHDGKSRQFLGNVAATVLPFEVRSDWSVLYDVEAANAEHIAGFQPSVALGVAYMLDRVADALEDGGEVPFSDAAYAIAVTYLQDSHSVPVEQPTDPRQPSPSRRPVRYV